MRNPPWSLRPELTPAASDGEAYLAKMRAGFLMPERRGGLGERLGLVDDGLHARRLQRPGEILLLPAAADDQALQALLPGHHQRSRHFAAASGQNPDQRDMAADATGGDGLRQR